MTTKHTEAFKREAVRIALTSGLSQERIAADMGIRKLTPGKWIARRRTADAVIAPQADLARENERLRLENRVLKEEGRDIQYAMVDTTIPKIYRLCQGAKGGLKVKPLAAPKAA